MIVEPFALLLVHLVQCFDEALVIIIHIVALLNIDLLDIRPYIVVLKLLAEQSVDAGPHFFIKILVEFHFGEPLL